MAGYDERAKNPREAWSGWRPLARRSVLAFSLLSAATVAPLMLATPQPAQASTVAQGASSAVCTWNDSAANGGNWSVGSNWVTTSGASCTGSGGPPAGATIVFPSGPTTTSVTYDSGTESGGGGAVNSSFDSIVFLAGGYTISQGGGAPTMTLMPTATPPIGITMALASSVGPDTLSNPIILGKSQSFYTTFSSGWRLALNGVISGSGSALTVTGSGGEVDLEGANTYSGGTWVNSGRLVVGNNSGLGPNSSAVTVENGAKLVPSGTVTLANPVTVGVGGGTLDAYVGTDTLTGAINLSGNAALETEPAGGALVLSGPISDGGSGYGLSVDDASPSAPQGVTLSGTNTYSGNTIVNSGTLVAANSSALGSGAVAVAPSATLAVNGGSTDPTNALGLSGTLEDLTGGDGWRGTITLSGTPAIKVLGAGSDFFIQGVVAGTGSLATNSTPSNGNTVDLEHANTYSGNTTVATGGVSVIASNAFGTIGTVTVDSGAFVNVQDGASEPNTLDISGSGTPIYRGALIVNASSTSGTWTGPVVLGAETTFNVERSGSTLTVSGPVSGSGTLDIAGGGTSSMTVLSGTNSYSGGTFVKSGVLDVTGKLSASSVMVDNAAMLQGSGTVAGITSYGTVHPGQSPGILTVDPGTALLSSSGGGGGGILSVVITGNAPGTGYSQLSHPNSGSAVGLDNATLVLSDTYNAPYGTVFTIVSGAGGVTGTFAGDPAGTVLTSNGHKLEVGYSATTATLTDVTNPPPTVTTGSATAVTGNSATLNGTVNANSLSTTYQFAYGTTTAYGSFAPAVAASVGSGATQIAVAANITGLAAGTTYHFALVATNANGTSTGSDATFTTSATQGYWEVTSAGWVYAFGNAGAYGSMGGRTLNQPIVGMAATPDGKGYWLVASDGGIFSFGDAVFYGSMGGKVLSDPVVGIASA